MAGVYRGLNVKVTADTHDLSEALNRIDADARKMQQNLSRASKALKLDPKNTELVGQKYKYLGEQIKLNEKRLKELKAAEAQLGKEKLGSEAWDTLQRDISATEQKIKSARDELRLFAAEQHNANSASGKLASKLTDWGAKLDPVGRKMQTVGRGMTAAITVPMIGIGAASVASAVKIDTALTGVKKTVNATEEEYLALKDAAIEYSKTNAVSAADILAAEELGGQLGVAKENLEAFAKVTTGLDIATNMNVDAASTNMARFMNVTKATSDASKTAAQQYEAYGNTIVGLGNNLATTESEISDFSLRMASAASLAGMSQADILGIGGAMSSLGLEAEAGGTAFSNTITQISMAVSTGNENLAGFAKIAGKSADEFASKWREDATGAFIDFINGLAAGKDAGQDMNVVLEELGITGIRQSDAIRRLAGNTELLGEAVRMANDQWREGTALGDEVANRNESLAAKFEMVKNRIIAIAEDIGVPVADALLDALDAAEPLFEMIESGARAFSEMSDEEQQAVIQTLAIIACMGPALSLFGKAASSVQALAGATDFLSKKKAALSVAMRGAGKEAGKVGVELSGVAAKGTAAAGAMAGLANITTALLIGGLVACGIALVDAIGKMAELEKATGGLEGAVRDFKPATDVGIESMDKMGGSADTLRDRLDDARESHVKLADEISKTMSDQELDARTLETYAQKIKDLAGNCREGSGDIDELKAALDGYNGIAGTTYSITDDTTGAISVSTTELDKNTKAWERNAYAQAAQEKLTELYKTKITDQSNLDAAQKKYDDAVAAYSADANDPDFNQERRDQAQGWIDDAKAELVEAQRLYDSSASAVDELSASIAENERRMRLSAQTTDDFKKALSDAGIEAGSFDAIAEKMGLSADDLASKLGTAGIEATSFAKLGVESFDRLREKAGMDIDGIAELLQSLNDAKVDPKMLTVNDDGSLAIAGQRIQNLDEMEIADKTYRVNDDGTITFNDASLNTLDGIQIGNKIYRVSDQNTSSAMTGMAHEVSDAVDGIPDQKNTEFTGDATGVQDAVGSALSWISRIPNRVSTFISGVFGGGEEPRSAAGGISASPIRIPRHADGGIAGIVTQATLTNQGWIGEDGTEAIVPLSNRRYVRPFANAVAAEMSASALASPMHEGFAAVCDEVAALRSDVQGMKVVMDGQQVGDVVTPYVNQNLGSDASRMGRGFR